MIHGLYHITAYYLLPINTEVWVFLISVAPIQQLAYMPIFHNPYCLYADPCLCEIYSYSLQLFTHSSVNYSIVHVLYIQPKVDCICSYRHIHTSSDCTCAV